MLGIIRVSVEYRIRQWVDLAGKLSFISFVYISSFISINSNHFFSTSALKNFSFFPLYSSNVSMSLVIFLKINLFVSTVVRKNSLLFFLILLYSSNFSILILRGPKFPIFLVIQLKEWIFSFRNYLHGLQFSSYFLCLLNSVCYVQNLS